MIRNKVSSSNIRRRSTQPLIDPMKIIKLAETLNIDTKIVQKLLPAFEKNAGKDLMMSFNQVMQVLKKQQNITVKKSELQKNFKTNSNSVEFFEFCRIYTVAKKIQDEEGNEETEILNSFVALGGEPDGSGSVKKEVIVNIVRNQFELMFNIEELLDKTTESEYLTFECFSHIFSKVQETQKEFRASMRSLVNEREVKEGEEGDEVKIKYQDFENWLLLNGL